MKTHQPIVSIPYNVARLSIVALEELANDASTSPIIRESAQFCIVEYQAAMAASRDRWCSPVARWYRRIIARFRQSH